MENSLQTMNPPLNADNVDEDASKMVDSLIEKAILGEIFDFHRAVAWGELDENAEIEDGSKYKAVEGYNVDVFGEKFKTPVFSCPFCEQKMGARRLMAHFSRCSARKQEPSRKRHKSDHS